MKQKKTEETPNAKGLALTINESLTDYVEKFESTQTESSHVKLNYREKHHYKSYKSMPLQATMTAKQWRCSTKNLKRYGQESLQPSNSNA